MISKNINGEFKPEITNLQLFSWVLNKQSAVNKEQEKKHRSDDGSYELSGKPWQEQMMQETIQVLDCL